MKNRQTF